ncbi:hypothetical protein ACRE_049130 [Hapsidospora chrysogenum ATCC 11550]|uniref:Uncharacterized protein n=1 Tax=Hapsidospora chrysogenum (strain ATCC 11550 / CBS 779.69 / DSM 880 / IAM 14645 / JCM 23072 / IMI 49137) TaxID=857340 RepID=A0A086T4L8_HAPC1|nr:hypothetical protein ACRE_049130 [Hapsidospora chrysogenum ATCC 11550]
MKFALIAALAAVASAQSKLSHSQAVSQLSAAGISVSSSGGCSDRNTPTCTSLEQVNADTVAGAVTLKGACGCTVRVTGGTETGHAGGTYSHWNGYKLDFSKTSGLNSYITNTFTRIADRGDGYPQWEAASGNIYCDEGNHWDVTFYTDGN